jgi:hypothetical protein
VERPGSDGDEEREAMSQVEEAWLEVGEQLKRLGALFRDHYEAQGVDEDPVVSEEEVAEAVQTLGAGMMAALGAAGDTLSDPELVTETRETAGAIFAALGATFSELGEQVAPDQEAADWAADEVGNGAEDE